MSGFISKIIIYLICFVISLYGLKGLDFNKIIKKNSVIEARVLYFLISIALTYIIGQFVMSIMYTLNWLKSAKKALFYLYIIYKDIILLVRKLTN